MSPKVLITVTIALNILHGIGIMFGAKEAAAMGVPNITPEALNMGAGAYEIAAFFNFFIAATLIPARSLGAVALRALSKGVAVGYVCLTGGIIYHMFSLIPGQAPPAPAGVIFGAITAWALYIAFATKDAETSKLGE